MGLSSFSFSVCVFNNCGVCYFWYYSFTLLKPDKAILSDLFQPKWFEAIVKKTKKNNGYHGVT